MDTSTLLYLAGFFFVLGAGIVGLLWVLVALFRSVSRKGKDSTPQDPNLAVLARLMRDLTSQELVVEMDGKQFKSASELSEAQQHRLGIISSVLVKWIQPSAPANPPVAAEQPVPVEPAIPAEPAAPVEPAETAISAEPTQPAPIPEPAPQPDAFITPPPAVAAVVAEQPAESAAFSQPSMNDWIPAEAAAVMVAASRNIPPFTTEPEPEVKPVSTQIPDLVRGIFNPAPAPKPAFKSIAMQINDLLQEKIAETQFESRGISVSDGPDHGVLVTLDGKKYAGVKDVPDEEVRSLLRSAVLEWEKHNKPTSK